MKVLSSPRWSSPETRLRKTSGASFTPGNGTGEIVTEPSSNLPLTNVTRALAPAPRIFRPALPVQVSVELVQLTSMSLSSSGPSTNFGTLKLTESTDSPCSLSARSVAPPVSPSKTFGSVELDRDLDGVLLEDHVEVAGHREALDLGRELRQVDA